MNQRSRAVLILVVGVLGLAGMGAGVSLARTSAASQFQLTLEGRHVSVPQSPDFPFAFMHEGTFTSREPFCAAGTFDDGSGTVDVWISPQVTEHDPPAVTSWRISGGAGSYTNLRGAGSARGELLTGTVGDPLSQTWRGAFTGSVAADAVAPTIAFTSAKVIKLRPARTYSIRLVVAIRDDGNPVGYTMVVKGNGVELARKVGSTASGAVTLTVRVRTPNARLRTLRVQVTATDPIGNERSLARSLTLPR